MLHAFSTNAQTLDLYRFLLGMGEVGNWPAGVKVVAEWFEPRERNSPKPGEEVINHFKSDHSLYGCATEHLDVV